MATTMPIRFLILACGNALRGDDGVGPWLANWAEEHFRGQPDILVVTRQQWTPDLAHEISRSESVLFLDASAAAAPGAIRLDRVTPAKGQAGITTHHVDAAQLLDLSSELYSTVPRNCLQLTIGTASTELSETFSQEVYASLPQACLLIENLIRGLDESIANGIMLQL